MDEEQRQQYLRSKAAEIKAAQPHEVATLVVDAYDEGRIHGVAAGIFIGLKERRDDEGEMWRRAEARHLLFQLLTLRRMIPTITQHGAIMRCLDIAKLEGWHARALWIRSIDELLD